MRSRKFIAFNCNALAAPFDKPMEVKFFEKHSLAWLLVGLTLAGLAVHAALFRDLDDFQVFFKAGQRILLGEALYRVEEIPMPFKYAPLAAAVFAPFAVAELPVGRVLWLIFLAALCWRVFRLSARLIGASGLSALLALSCCIGALKHMFLYGQCDVMLLWLALESQQLKDRPWTSGALLALALMFKPPMLLVVIALVLLRQWHRALSTMLFTGLFLIAPALWWGPARLMIELASWRSMLAMTTGPMICTTNNQGAYGLACLFSSPSDAFQFSLLGIFIGAGSAMLLAIPLWQLHKHRVQQLELAIVSCALFLSAFLSPLAWRSNLLSMLPMTFLLAESLAQATPRTRWLVCSIPWASTLFQVLGFELLGPVRFLQVLGARLVGLLALATMVLALWRLSLTQTRARHAQAV
jgi:Glycosyltransferase family 87